MKKYLLTLLIAASILIVSLNAQASTIALLPMDGANGSTTFSDIIGNTWTGFGNARISTAQSTSGGASAYFDGSGDYVQADNAGLFNFGTSPFTIDLWIYPLSVDTGSNAYLAGRSHPDGGQGYDIRLQNEILIVGVNGWDFNIGTPSVNDINYLTASAWHNVILTSSASNAYLYVDGDLKGTSPRSNISNGINPFRIAYQSNYGGTAYYGYIDEFKITDELWTPTPVSNGVVPEPATLSLLSLGLLGLAFNKKRRNAA